jgi:hypothetical protein
MGIMMENNFETMELAVKEQAEELARVNEEIRNITAVVKVLADKIDSFADKRAHRHAASSENAGWLPFKHERCSGKSIE